MKKPQKCRILLMGSLKKLKANGKFAVDTNAVIAYREAVLDVCTLIDGSQYATLKYVMNLRKKVLLFLKMTYG
jgi:hypothetical protein